VSKKFPHLTYEGNSISRLLIFKFVSLLESTLNLHQNQYNNPTAH